MRLLSLNIENPLYARLAHAARQNELTVEQFVCASAEESVSQFEIFEAIKDRAKERDAQAAFEKLLASVPDADPIHPDDVIK